MSGGNGGGGNSVVVTLESKVPSLDDKMNAQKFCKFAMSALQFDDVATARKYIKDAMTLLGTD